MLADEVIRLVEFIREYETDNYEYLGERITRLTRQVEELNENVEFLLNEPHISQLSSDDDTHEVDIPKEDFPF